ncbi:MAG: nickel pincer cofactor biosynthesis protein LarC [Ignisphaera sp.]
MKVLVVDPSIAGISGDMLLSAFVALGFQPQNIMEVAKAIEKIIPWVKRVDVEVAEVRRHGVRAWRTGVHIDEEKKCRKGIEVINAVENIAKFLSLSDRASKIALNAANLLIEAEAEVHGEGIEDVDLCEISSADTVIDLIGVAYALQELNLLEADVYGLPIAIGGGTIKFSHGRITAPAPVVVEIAKKKNLAIIGGPVEEELATPTGVALYATIVKHIVGFYPSIRVTSVGYGAGSKDLEGMPNILRLIVGETPGEYTLDNVVVLETDIDDVSGEILGYVGEKLISLGALDVGFIPRIGKKGRPSITLRVLARTSNSEELIDAIVRETGTLGVRVFNVTRYIVPYRYFEVVSVYVNDKRYDVKVKISKTSSGKIVAVKPEYEDLKKISTETGVPIKKLIDEVMKKLSYEV